MRDTTQAAEQVRVEAIRRLEPGLRLRQALELSESFRSLAVFRLREWHPERTDLELVELLLGGPLITPRPATRRK
jgi:hypothetical protein